MKTPWQKYTQSGIDVHRGDKANPTKRSETASWSDNF